MTIARCLLLSLCLTMAAGATLFAQDQGAPVKALSKEQVADLMAGRGMGLALVAELNGYPGPRHVLDLADQLELTTDQRAKTQALFEAMKAEAIPIGARIIADEAELDRLFAQHRITPDVLDALTARIASAQGKLRATHLSYHLRMMEVLSPEQVAHYMVLRGHGMKHQHGTEMP
jgi:hypothetical protein